MRRRVWILPVLLVVLVGGHGVVLYYVTSHFVLSAAVLSGAVILLGIKHLGLLGSLSELLRSRRSGKRP